MKKFALSLSLALAASLVSSPAYALFDSDSDGLPDQWELYYFGNLNETASGDPDWDSLTNLDEYNFKSNPASDDTDQDMVHDDFEMALGTDPNWTDTDGDGCTDGEEFTMHDTDPMDPESHSWCGEQPPSASDDFDNDGLGDMWEIYNYSWLWDQQDGTMDYDGDGLSNLAEYNAGTVANRTDTDWDEISDGDEVLLGTDPLNWDSDGDGCSDGNEYLTYSTDPLDPNSNNCQ